MRNTNGIVKTYDYMSLIHEYFNDYQLTHQYDAEQCLRYILQICYPDIHNAASDNDFDSRFNDQFIFRVTINETTECEQDKGGCGNITDQFEILITRLSQKKSKNLDIPRFGQFGLLSNNYLLWTVLDSSGQF